MSKICINLSKAKRRQILDVGNFKEVDFEFDRKSNARRIWLTSRETKKRKNKGGKGKIGNKEDSDEKEHSYSNGELYKFES